MKYKVDPLRQNEVFDTCLKKNSMNILYPQLTVLLGLPKKKSEGKIAVKAYTYENHNQIRPCGYEVRLRPYILKGNVREAHGKA